MVKLTIAEKLKHLRALMKERGLDYYIVPSRDQHNNEYVPRCWLHREWISGFTGSAGLALVGPDHAWLFTDSRYFIQAQDELDQAYYDLVRQNGFTAQLETWFEEKSGPVRVGIDSFVVSPDEALSLSASLEAKGGALIASDVSLIEAVRKKLGDLPDKPSTPVSVWPESCSGESVAQKLGRLRQYPGMSQVDALLLTNLDEIAWLYNIRGADVDFNPLVISYAIVTKDEALWFVEPSAVGQDVRSALESQRGRICAYEDFKGHVRNLNGRIWLDGKSSSLWIRNLMQTETKVISSRSPVALLKACKNKTEIGGMEAAHKKDAVAVISFLHWLENNWSSGVSELSLSDTLEGFRKKNPDYLGPSFTTISGFESNGAICHYRVSAASSKVVDDSSLYLVDSGAQYQEGTTDITRTVHLGTPTNEQKKHYTLVLKGHLSLGNAVFCKGAMGEHLDVLARMHLWKEGLNYGHGTGHGVGCYLCVHEGPQKISPAATGVPLEAGMVVSNEPGLYLEGRYGIRIENLCYVTPLAAEKNSETEGDSFYKFTDLTLVPYAKNLIDKDLLSSEEIRQIDDYHRLVFETMKDLVDPGDRAWLESSCKPL